MDLSFTNDELALLCNRQGELVAWAGDSAAVLEQLLNELDCADTLGRIEELPHVLLLRAPQGRVGAHSADDAGVLLKPELNGSETIRDAEAAVIVAVAAGEEQCNPEGAAWPRAVATSRITQ